MLDLVMSVSLALTDYFGMLNSRTCESCNPYICCAPKKVF